MPLGGNKKQCVVTRMHLDWFNKKFCKSECANVKRFYLSNGAKTCKEESHALQHEILRCGNSDVANSEEIELEDELELIENSKWTLSKGLQAARIIALDERTLWECIGSFFQQKACKIINLWNEQIAVKILYEFIMLPVHEISYHLREELIEHMTAHIKPKDIKLIDGLYWSQNCDKPELTSTDHNVVASLNGIHDEESEYERWLKSTVAQAAVQVRPMKMSGHDICEGALICAKAVEAFGELLRIPRKEMFYLENIYENCTLAIAIQQLSCLHILYENEEIMLVLCLIYEQFIVGINDSVWRALLLTCPCAYPHMPVFWSAQDLAELEGTDVLDGVIRKREETRTFCDEITPLLGNIYTSLCENDRVALLSSELVFVNAFSYDAVLWARATFDSRAFKLNIDGNIRVTLVPLADMINHNNCSDVIVRKVLDNNGDFVMQIGAPLTNEDVHSHRELWMSYGPLQNWELLEHYGFVLAENEFDRLPFTVSWENAYTDDHSKQGACGIAEHTNENDDTCAEEEYLIKLPNSITHQIHDDGDDDRDGKDVDAKQKIGEMKVREINNYADNAANDVNIIPSVSVVTDITDANTNNNLLNSSNTFIEVKEAKLTCNCAQEKREFLLNYYHLILANQMWISVSGVPPDALIALLRIMLCTENELNDLYAEISQRLHHCKGPFAKLSNKTELAIIDTIRTVLLEWLSSLSFSLDENVANLEAMKNDHTSNTSNSSCDDSDNENADEAIHTSTNSVLALELLISLQSIADRCLRWCNNIQRELQ